MFIVTVCGFFLVKNTGNAITGQCSCSSLCPLVDTLQKVLQSNRLRYCDAETLRWWEQVLHCQSINQSINPTTDKPIKWNSCSLNSPKTCHPMNISDRNSSLHRRSCQSISLYRIEGTKPNTMESDIHQWTEPRYNTNFLLHEGNKVIKKSINPYSNHIRDIASNSRFPQQRASYK